MTDRFGVHMGNSTVCLSMVKEGKIDIVASKFGDRCSFAVVSVADETELIIGLPAKQGLVRNGTSTVVNNLQFLDEDLSEADFLNATNNCVCAVTNDPKIEYNLTKDDISRKLTPYEVAVRLFSNLYENASQAAKADTKHEAVLALPMHFSEKSRQTLVAAAAEAGFDILQIVSEPAAALLAYEIGFDYDDTILNAPNTSEYVLVYRLGGLTLDVTLFRIVCGLYEKVADRRSSNIGGHLLTKALADYMATEFYNKYKLNPRESRRTMIKLAQHAEECKHILSSMQSSHVFIESLMDGVDWSQNISRARFENLISSQLQQFVRPIEEILSEHSTKTIGKIILCGGSMKIPKIKSTISSIFPQAQILDSSIPADEIIAIGAAKQASIVNLAWDSDGDHLDIEVPTICNDIYIQQENNQTTCLFAKGSIVPSNAITVPIKANTDGKVTIKVIQTTDEPDPNVDDADVITHDGLKQDCDVRVKLSMGHHHHPSINFIFPNSEEQTVN